MTNVVAEERDGLRLGRGVGRQESMKWRTHETVAQYVQMVQHNQIFALAAGVVVHQHTRVLMEDLRWRGDDMSVADVQAGMQQLLGTSTSQHEVAMRIAWIVYARGLLGK